MNWNVLKLQLFSSLNGHVVNCNVINSSLQDLYIMTLGLPDIISSKIWPATSSFFVLSRFIFHKKDHPYIMSAKDWMGGSRKRPVLLSFSTYNLHSGWFKKSPKLWCRNICMVPKQDKCIWLGSAWLHSARWVLGL